MTALDIIALGCALEVLGAYAAVALGHARMPVFHASNAICGPVLVIAAAARGNYSAALLSAGFTVAGMLGLFDRVDA